MSESLTNAELAKAMRGLVGCRVCAHPKARHAPNRGPCELCPCQSYEAPAKFNARRTTCREGHRHDSMREAQRCEDLHLLQKGGVISDLVVHPRFPLSAFRFEDSCPEKVCDYEADSQYVENGRLVVEDVKSKPTKTALYQLKKRLMKACHGIEILETR